MIKSNWPIKNLIISLDLFFMQIRPTIIRFDLEFTLFLYLLDNEVQLVMILKPRPTNNSMS